MKNSRNRAAYLAALTLIANGPLDALADPPSPSEAASEAARAPLGVVMQGNGGSLFRAEVAGGVINGQAPSDGSSQDSKPTGIPGTFTAVSFFSVEAPKPKTYKKHDLITIIAKEESAFTSNGVSNLQKTQDYDSKLNSFINLRPSKLRVQSVISGDTNVPEINFTNARDYKGTGDVERTDTFSDRVTAEVVDVKPNGTLVLQAIKRIKTDEEEQRMILTGICRADDVAADNTVLTTQLFDLELEQTHKGAVNETTQRGFIPRLLDQFSPF
jgi:flagellar L-ring protein precursor FlgH